ncbi:unnamed protein product [Toxocara canis]|uniref:RING-type domain-containing protein n=1 Tax=Toxocara canis TaxID=6265 RepID=A0A183V1R0_TOXCA|nr:unnamed protein product [Toxocara canis]
MDKAIKADGCAKTLESKLYLILDLNCNKLSSLSAADNDEDLLKMDGILKEVNASRNLLRVFPKALLAIHSLIALDLSENQLTDLPSEICTLSNLEQLNLKANRLQKLPGTIGKLKKLQKLDVSSNLIRRLPLEMSQLDNLRELHVDIEKIEFPCADVCGGDTESLKRYLMNLSPCSSHSTNSAAVSSEWDENATLVDRSDISTCAFGSNDVVRYPEANTIDEGAIAFDSEKANRERGMRLEQLRKEQEELDLLVGRVFAQRLQDRQDIADAVNQMEGHAQSIIDNALQVLVSSSNTISDDIAQDELDVVLRRCRDDLRKDQEDWLQSMEEEGIVLSELVCKEAEERRRKSMEEITKKVAEVDVLLLSKSDEERKKFQKICAEIVADQNILADFVVSIRERADERSRVLHSQIELIEKALVDISIIEMQRRNERTAINAEQLENERRSLSMLYEQYLAERDFRRKQLFMQMRVDVEKEEDEQKRIAAECLRRYAELLAPRSNRSPQRRSVSGAERFGRFKAIFGRKKNAERTSSPKKIVDQSAINKKGSSTSDSTSLNPTSSSSHSIVKARYEEECVVCMDRPVKLLISPCGHVCICEQCSLSVEECPLCRTYILNRILLSHF